MSSGKFIERLHYNCRNAVYPRSSINRFAVPDDKVSWEVSWLQYTPNYYTSPSIKNQVWADSDVGSPSFKPLWNALDGTINRKSHGGAYKVVDGFPLNPVGRTGIVGRGLLGRWGPNHAADPILTRWKRDSTKSVENDKKTGKPILQFVGIQRRDCGMWAIPGGMIDPGETVTSALKREFMEEALNVLCDNEEKKKEKENLIENFFANGTEIYKGYVDDPRNTDNSWMETVATNFHDEDGTLSEQVQLEAGDDASKSLHVAKGLIKYLLVSEMANLREIRSEMSKLFNEIKLGILEVTCFNRERVKELAERLAGKVTVQFLLVLSHGDENEFYENGGIYQKDKELRDFLTPALI